MPNLAPIILSAIMVILAVGAIFSLFRGLYRGLHTAHPRPYVPILPINPPEPVVRTIGVELVGWTGIIWCVAHLGILAVWAMSVPEVGLLFRSASITVLVMAYSFIAAVFTGAGGIMMLKLMSYGRRMLAWGTMLFGVSAVFGVALCLVLRVFTSGDFYNEMRQYGGPAAVFLATHAVIDTLLGAAAQHVGKSPTPEGNE